MVSLKTLKWGKEIQPVPQTSIKDDLMNARRVVIKAYNASQAKRNGYDAELEQWQNRLIRVRRVLTFTKDEEAKKDLSVLQEQATEYRNHFRDLLNDEDSYFSSLHKQYKAIEAAVARFQLMETRQSLNEDLRQISGGLRNSRAGGLEHEDSQDFQNVEKIIQTALALVELKEQKALGS